jgi:hypothetical protein
VRASYTFVVTRYVHIVLDGKLRGRCGTPGYVAPEILKSGMIRRFCRLPKMPCTLLYPSSETL